MIPVGYLAKHVSHRTEWLAAPTVLDIYSVSNCISANFADYLNYRKHNGYYFFDSPKVIREVAEQYGIELSGTTLFFYEAYEREYDDSEGHWSVIRRDESISTVIELPPRKVLEGYDVVTYSCGTTAECSPLSCNGLAQTVKTNSRCLLESLEQAIQLIEQGDCQHSEPGPFRIIAVYSTKWH